MSLISATIPNLVNGISQQAPAARLASQAEDQLNAMSSVSTGLAKRPPTYHRGKLSSVPYDGAFIHSINRDITERYQVVIADGRLRVYRLDGSEVSVAFPDGTAYLTSSAPAGQFRALSVLDFTFIVNRGVLGATTAATLPVRPPEALVWVKQGAYAAKYTLTVGRATVEHTTPDASQPAHAAQIQTDAIAVALQTKLDAALAGTGIFTARIGSVLYINSNANFEVRVSDSIGDSALSLVKSSVQRFSDLPVKAVEGFKIRVAGGADNAFDDYWTEYAVDAGNPNGGTWKEAARGGERYQLDASTMPHVLVRNSDGTFTFKRAAWDARTAGDTESVPFPSLVGAYISDVFFHRNRLGFLANESVVMSRAGSYFNFFRKTALQVLDSDPIDVAVAAGGGEATLRHSAAFNEGLLLFSDQAQFQFGRADLLTPKTASITLTTQFGCSRAAKPVGSGKNVYFVTARGGHSAIREYYLDGDTRTNDAADVTAHCPHYLPNNIVNLAATANEDILVTHSPEEPNVLWVYRYYWQGTTKLQSSWSKWTLGPGDRVLAFSFISSSLWLVIGRSDGTFLEEMPMEPGRTDAGTPFEYRLDRRIGVVGAAAPEQNFTHVRVPYRLPVGQRFDCVATTRTRSYTVGQIVPYRVLSEDAQGTVLGITGEFGAGIFGASYEMRYRFSPLLVREEASGGGQQPVTEGRLQVRKMTLTHAETGYYRVEVTPTARDTFTYTFSGRVLGSEKNRIGRVGVESGLFSFPVASKNDEVVIDIVNDSYHASTFLSASWEAFYATRSRRL